MQKPFLYLVQGQAKLVKSYLGLADQEDSDAIFLTYDEPLDKAIFFPESTWAQGRNKLLSTACKEGNYLYYIFCDDDIEFKKGSWQEFNKSLLKYKPGIAVPVFPRTRGNILKYPQLTCQPFFINDEQLIAFHRDIVDDRIVLPYQERFDQINWWASCEIQQILIQNFYYFDAVQFNNIEILNTCDQRYETQHDNDKSFRQLVKGWLDEQLTGNYKLTAQFNPPRLHHILRRALVFSIKSCSGRKRHSVNIKTLARRLSPGTELAKQAKKT